MSELPNNWTTARLVDLAEDISYGYTASSTRERTGPHLLRITDIQENEVLWSSVPYCEIDSEQADKYLLKENDLVFARTGATVGKSFLIKGEIPDAVFASYLIRVRCMRPEAAGYLSLYFRSQDYWRQITGFSAGIGQPNVNGSKLKELVIPLPPLAEQTRIAAKLDELLAQVDTLKARIDGIPALLKRLRQSVLAAAVSGRLTEEWRVQHSKAEWKQLTFGDAGEVSGGLTKNSKRRALPLAKPYLRVANVHANNLNLDDVTQIGLTEKEFEKTRLVSGDVLIVEGNGSLDHIGRAAIWNNEIPDCCHQNHLIRWRANNGVHPKFALYQLLSPQGRKQLVEVAKSTTGLHTLSISKVSALKLPIPVADEQTEIVHRVEQLFTFADQLEARVKAAQARIDRLTQSILAKAFRGELVPQAPNDEPAGVLLERIKAQRATAPKAKRGRRAATLN